MEKSIKYFSFIASRVSISLCVFYVKIDETEVTLSSLLSFFGLIITVLAFTVGAYFALIAIRAYEHLSTIEKVKKKLINLSSASKNVLRQHAEFTLKIIEFQLYLEELKVGKDLHKSNRIIKIRDELKLMRARMAYLFPMLNDDTRIKLLKELSVFGIDEDLPFITELLKTVEPGSEIYNVIKEAELNISSKHLHE